MIKLNILQAFHVFYKYIVADCEFGPDSHHSWVCQSNSDTWEVRDALSAAGTDPDIACHSGGPTADPAVWEVWGEIIEEVLQDEKLRATENQQDAVFLTREQALKVMECFLEKRYWNKNNDMLLKDAVADIDRALAEKNFEATEVWKQWIECVPYGLAFKEEFNDEYFRRLEEMRVQSWKDRGEM